MRELQNAMERAVVLGSTELVLPEDLPDTVWERRPAAEESGYQAALVATKRQLVLQALDEASGNITAAARALGLNANYLHRLMRNLGLRHTAPE